MANNHYSPVLVAVPTAFVSDQGGDGTFYLHQCTVEFTGLKDLRKIAIYALVDTEGLADNPSQRTVDNVNSANKSCRGLNASNDGHAKITQGG